MSERIIPTVKVIALSRLRLDTANYRHGNMGNVSEVKIVNAILKESKNQKRYKALINKFNEEGFTLSELPIVQPIPGSQRYKVLEGNRRVSILRLIHGYIPLENINLSSYFKKLLSSFQDDFKEITRKIRCEVYPPTEEGTRAAFQEIARLHSGGDAARDDWTSIAKARQERDCLINRHYELDLFERFCDCYPCDGKYAEALEDWRLSFKLDQLDEATKYLSKLYGLGTDGAKFLSEQYEKLPESFRSRLENVICAIGNNETQYVRDIRDEHFWKKHDFSTPREDELQQFRALRSESKTTSPVKTGAPGASEETSTATPGKETGGKRSPRAKSIPASDTRKGIVNQLNMIHFTNERYRKLQTLHKEIVKLAGHDLPNVFAIALRSFLDIASVIYCDNYKCYKNDKRHLKDRVVDAIDHIKNHAPGWKDSQQAKKLLDTARTCLTQNTLLSIGFLNEIVHNKDNSFTITNETITGNLSKIIPLMLALTENEPPK